MGRAFRRLSKQVEGRNPLRERYVTASQRIGELEVFLLEIGQYLSVHVATDPDDPSDAAFCEAFSDFKKLLERVVTQRGGTTNG